MKKILAAVFFLVLISSVSLGAELLLLIAGVKAGGPEGPYQNYVHFNKFELTSAGASSLIVAERRVDALSSAIHTTFADNPSFRAMQGAVISDTGGIIELRIGGGKIEKITTKGRGTELIEEITISSSGITPTYTKF